MTKEFVPYGLAVKLKELGFNEPCFGYRDGIGHLMIKETPHGGISAPTYSQAFRWFREKYDLFCWIEKFHKDETYIFQIPPANFTKIQGDFKTYEEAELACLQKLIQIVKPK